MKLMTPVPTKYNEKRKPFVSVDLKLPSHIFIKYDAVKKNVVDAKQQTI